MRGTFAWACFGSVLALVGCDDETPGSAADAGTGEDAAMPVMDASGEVPADDYERLYTCDVEEPCGLSFAGNLEGGDNAITHSRLLCTIMALRDRQPGRYLHDTDSSFSSGSSSVRHTMLVHADGSVQYVRTVTIDGAKTVPPAERCVLQPASYFDACVAALNTPETDSGSEPWICAFGDGEYAADSELGWFESCETETPLTCP